MGQTAFEKIWNAHRVAELGDGTDLILVDRVLLHERTGGVALKSLADSGRQVNDPAQVFATMDHIVDTLPNRSDYTIMPTGRDFILATREASEAAGITLFDLHDPRQGIVHVISPELGIILPGATLVCPDSHTCSQGALGGLAWGIGSSEAEHVLATSTLRVNKPKTMRVTITGKLSPGVTAKDLALYIISEVGSAGAVGHLLEYAGEAVSDLEVEARLTLCNMATELGAFTAFIAPDEKVFSYLKGRDYAPKGAEWDLAVSQWKEIFSDDDAVFDRDITIAGEDVPPMVSWGVSPQQAAPIDGPVPQFEDVSSRDSREIYDRALSYMALEAGLPLSAVPIDAAFIGSCTNSRMSDLRRAAALLKGRKVAPHVKAICVPGSTAVKKRAEEEGLDKIFLEAGFEWRESGCSMCFFAGGESFGAEERVVTSTNRNFESRQGPKTRSHLASPETVAASAIFGHIADARLLAKESVQ
ncbi:3-isopropylmalate dehydratase large subunit [Ponticaulis sp.]|uniref:3-isopropylmalate dehydratase large subunit n=1 Tax=Ponticaulis sp. TaxID=2020902 RepID=UPI000B6FFD9C|nr:3-isopropylmalate dehydratase large subunit [Ponticaulis sp.]MAI91263.1 3-isopropylmalate dehydratase large subunit [Ponticaulis sp.]OUX98617.1 MAG: 3-isopropylmalate dehydratase large subunit [Hyphomonadaceae bacterium TMED5]